MKKLNSKYISLGLLALMALSMFAVIGCSGAEKEAQPATISKDSPEAKSAHSASPNGGNQPS
ncbi:MAG: hypothetical protein JSS72_13205 [Armatimonadetes bacterium]|nr:hypothetical protein [Armatimonadota bacterium]